MTARAGERAYETGDFHCAHCDAVVHVIEGNEIPLCPNGHDEYDSRSNEPMEPRIMRRRVRDVL